MYKDRKDKDSKRSMRMKVLLGIILVGILLTHNMWYFYYQGASHLLQVLLHHRQGFVYYGLVNMLTMLTAGYAGSSLVTGCTNLYKGDSGSDLKSIIKNKLFLGSLLVAAFGVHEVWHIYYQGFAKLFVLYHNLSNPGYFIALVIVSSVVCTAGAMFLTDLHEKKLEDKMKKDDLPLVKGPGQNIVSSTVLDKRDKSPIHYKGDGESREEGDDQFTLPR